MKTSITLILVLESEKVSIYSPKFLGETHTEFERFLENNGTYTDPQLQSYFTSIIGAVNKIKECGARENLFRPEGKRVKALPLFVQFFRNKTNKGKMRLFCLRISESILILGNGGVSKERKYEDDNLLLSYVNVLRSIDKELGKAAKKQRTHYGDTGKMKSIINTFILHDYENE